MVQPCSLVHNRRKIGIAHNWSIPIQSVVLFGLFLARIREWKGFSNLDSASEGQAEVPAHEEWKDISYSGNSLDAKG